MSLEYRKAQVLSELGPIPENAHLTKPMSPANLAGPVSPMNLVSIDTNKSN